MKKLKIFPKMFIQIFSVLGIIIILVHLLVYFIFPKTYLETRKEKIHNIADEISGNMNGKEMKYIEQTLELYSKSSETSVYKGYKQDKIEMRGDRAEMSDFPLYLNTVAGGLDRRDQTIGGFSFVVKIYAVPVVEIIG